MRVRSSIAVLAALQSCVACSDTHGASTPAVKPGQTAPVQTAPVQTAPVAGSTPLPQPVPSPPPDAGTGLSPPPVIVTSTSGLPEPAPECPGDAPAAGTPCTTEPGTALSCAWKDGSEIERCACVSKEGLPPGTELLWNCEDGPSGEGPPTSTCPDAAPAAGTACMHAGTSCVYASPPNTKCECRPGPLLWECGPAAFGGP